MSLQWKEAKQKETKKLICEGVIERAQPGTTFSFISPAHWVVKDSLENRFRLVTDLLCLNYAVEQEVSRFLTLSDEMTTVNPSSKFCIVNDLASPYHQLNIPITYESFLGL